MTEAEQAEAACVKQAEAAAARAETERPKPNVPTDKRRSKRERAPRVDLDASNVEMQGAPADDAKSKKQPSKTVLRGQPEQPLPKQQRETERKETPSNKKPPPPAATPMN
eukprot:309807-Pleurochrysis_carterae.AAC.1